MLQQNHTIVAPATPNARSAIAVLRLSGPEAVAIAQAVFRPHYIESLTALPGYHAAYGTLHRGGVPLDEGVALVFRAPKSYTGEDMVELSCHGNPAIAARIVAACIEAGARPAAAGEFTRRAFENGKLDLTEAEAVAELICAQGERAATAALQRRTGALGEAIFRLMDVLTMQAAQLAVWSDFPEEEDAPVVTAESMQAALAPVQRELGALADAYHSGRLIQKGIEVVIAGSPNVGKSTLLNRLCGAERAIVTDIAGTTRDIVEVTTELDGVALRLLDTAGLRESDDMVERIGVQRAREAIERCDLVLLVADGGAPDLAAHQPLLAQLKAQQKPYLLLYNKQDLPAAEKNAPDLQGENVVLLSARTGDGVDVLRERIKAVLGLNLSQDSCLIASQRQFDCVLRARAALAQALEQLEAGVTLDAAGILLEEAIAPLAELVGQYAGEAVLEKVFANFCVGK